MTNEFDDPPEDELLPGSPDKTPIEYLVVADKTSKVILSTNDYPEAVRMANLIRRAGGEVTIFRSLKS